MERQGGQGEGGHVSEGREKKGGKLGRWKEVTKRERESEGEGDINYLIAGLTLPLHQVRLQLPSRRFLWCV